MECAKDGASLDYCVAIAVVACKEAERDCPRTGPGRRPDVPDWVVAVMVVIGAMLRKKTRSAQFVFWKAREPEFCDWFPAQRMLSRSQFYERARRISPLLHAAIKHLGTHAVKRGWADVECVAIDKSLLAARGRKRSTRQKRLPRGVDADATWGYSAHDGWVFGYSYEVLVSAGKRAAEWPLLASVDTASCSEQKSCLDKFAQLPRNAKYVLADAGYDSNRVGETVEWTTDGQPTGRRFLCPEIPRPQAGLPRKANSRETRVRQHHRRLRNARRQFKQSPRGRRLYQRRGVTVELFNSRFKHAFDLHDRVWHRRLANNQVSILAAIAAYQTLLTYNHRKHRRHTRIQYLLDSW